jgi:hypothetical protein
MFVSKGSSKYILLLCLAKVWFFMILMKIIGLAPNDSKGTGFRQYELSVQQKHPVPYYISPEQGAFHFPVIPDLLFSVWG